MKIWFVKSVLVFLVILGGSLACGAVSDHVYFLGLSKGPDYNHPWYPSSKVFEFTLGVVTDTSIVKIEFVTPSGVVKKIPPLEYYEYVDEAAGYTIVSEREVDNGEVLWEWEIKASNEVRVAAFGDGVYQVRCYYTATQYYQTSVRFLIPGTYNPLPQPTQIPEVTWPAQSTMVPASSDFQMQWQACTDPAVNSINVYFEDDYRGVDYDYDLAPSATSSPAVSLLPGFYDGELCFNHSYFVWDNGDEIPMVIQKTCNINHSWSVSPYTRIDMRDMAGLASVWGRDGCDPEVNNACDGYDLDESGVVDLVDLAQLLETWLSL